MSEPTEIAIPDVVDASTTPAPPVPWAELRATARATATHAYAPYSTFQVGAALWCQDGSVFTGVNVENAAYTGSHAEVAAISAWVTAGRRSPAVAISSVALPGDRPAQVVASCGNCLQQLAEVGGLSILVDGANGPVRLSELLPASFGPHVLPQGIGPGVPHAP